MAKLKPRARIIRTIGDQLISGPEAALIELVKNSFDADSPYANIKIEPKSKTTGGKIVIDDNGHGMNLEDVIGKWFEPATDHKKKNPTSPKGRSLLGAKGIGRFAAARLGDKTELLSATVYAEGKIEEVLVSIDWQQFTAEQYLDELDIPVDNNIIDKTESTKTGVSLCITELRDDWTQKKLENLIRELRRVSSPIEDNSNFKIRLDLSAFIESECGFDGHAIFSLGNSDLSPTDTEEENDKWLIHPFKINEHADYKLTGKFDQHGSFSGEFTICRGDNQPQPLLISAPKLSSEEENCGEIEININIYDRETESVAELFKRMDLNFETIGIRLARKILNENSGISIFRNGFRIRPYGDPENDWLELERQRVQNPSKKLGTSQVSGKILIQSEGESKLIERSSREGLEHNGSFQRIKSLIHILLTHAEERRVDFREKAGLSRKIGGDVEQAKELATLKNSIKAVEKLPENLRQPLLKAIEKDSMAIKTSLEEIDAYQILLQSRASLGLVVSQVIHEGRRILNPMSESAHAIKDHHQWLIENSKRGEITRKQLPDHANVLTKGTKDLSKLFKRLDPVSGRRRGSPATFNINHLITSSIQLFDDSIKDFGIEISSEISSESKAYGYEEDLQAAILNILENAIHWLETIDLPRKIWVNEKQLKKKIQISISNNGPPVDDNYHPRLFNAGFSLKPDGTGLGLAIAREACRASKGDLLFDDQAADTTFIIEFPTP